MNDPDHHRQATTAGYFNRRDKWHRWVADQMATLALPLLTCEPVLTEACFLIHKAG